MPEERRPASEPGAAADEPGAAADEPGAAADETGAAADETGAAGDERGLTHLDALGRVRMVDVGRKPVSRRRAVAEGVLRMRAETLEALVAGEIEKGDALAVARIAAIAGAKRTAEVVPLCHPLPLDAIEVELSPEPELPGVRLRVTASAEARTGVEMEALTGAAVGLLALYDMCKAAERGMSLGPIRLLEKTGGSSGGWRRGGEA